MVVGRNPYGTPKAPRSDTAGALQGNVGYRETTMSHRRFTLPLIALVGLLLGWVRRAGSELAQETDVA